MIPFFTADTHLGHARMIELAGRPFASVEEMDETLIENWNRIVPRNGVVYHLGDFACGAHDPYLRRLNGEKHLVPGNHDHRNLLKKSTCWHTIEEKLHFIKALDNIQIVLCHYALRTWRNSHHGALHFYGHSHGGLPGDAQSCDVGVDCSWTRFAPVHLEEIKAWLSCLPDRHHPDHHQPKVKDPA